MTNEEVLNRTSIKHNVKNVIRKRKTINVGEHHIKSTSAVLFEVAII